MISIVINADTRPGLMAPQFTVGDDGGQGSLHGCRSIDYLTELPKLAHKFFAGHDHEIILYIDLHEEIPREAEGILELFALSCGDTRVRVIAESNDHSQPRWNDIIYLKALQLAEGDYVVKMDQDCAIFRSPECDIVDRYLQWLEEYKFVCQPTDLTKEQHGMWWASTRFFICRKETLDWSALWDAVREPYSLFNKYPWDRDPHLPCFEHYLGVIAGKDGVLYPPRDDGPDGYTVANWVVYHKGVLQALNKMPYPQVAETIQKTWGLMGPSDCITTPLS